ncbi:PrsW family intramembrane metalloprotease [Georgenia alba]|uniref:PrsW family intramembrane metalloprotease n=1 Tax=Georgenia alba TaxID=2233858 RepID=A0ABW2Q9N3_9MICO
MSSPGPQSYGPHGYGPQSYPAAPMWPQPKPRSSLTLLLEIIGIALGLAGALYLVAYVASATGVGATAVSSILALFPLAGVIGAVLWVDRWEPEPKWLLAAAFAWGAGVSTAVSLWLNTAYSQSVYNRTGDDVLANTLGAVVGAPLVEESIKCLGVLLIFLLRRKFFDGPVDGIVYAAVVAAGFAFTENILYFAQNSAAGALGMTFVMRGIMSPFAHLIFTAAAGIALGFASRSRNSLTWVWAFPIGLVGAMLLHAVWNASASLGGVMLVAYFLFQVPLFAAVIVLVVWLRNDEKATIGNRLSEYAQAGWFAPHEIQMLTSLKGRRLARSWAGARGARAKEAMKTFQKQATALAYTRQRALTGRYDFGVQRDEQELLATVNQARAGFMGAPA